ncbi:hypothetical protein [Vibrio alginolyticus]|uniref:hypothetical protein n=1 Tax=Vibrio alginolyticus TaxID=663 RepID=UPI0006CA8EED|nr:hypothetical protein [Vibrio alginolyticus]KPM98671.1 hypothetical protein AOG25_09705 [Vibrio alginolyticus]CAH7167241.1 conserved hypothetical protein [Vibrio chagasii]
MSVPEIIDSLFTLLMYAGVAVLVIGLLYLAMYVKPESQAYVLVINGIKSVRISLTGGLRIPRMETYQQLEIVDKLITIKRVGTINATDEEQRGLSCKCGVRMDLDVGFYFTMPKEEKALLEMVQNIDVAILNSEAELTKFLKPKLNEILKDTVGKLEYKDIMLDKAAFKTKVFEEMKKQLKGLMLQDVAINDVKHSDLESHDPSNMDDARGIEKITGVVTEKKVATTKLKEKSLTDIKTEQETGETDRKRIELQNMTEREQITRDENAEKQGTTLHAENLKLDAEQDIAKKKLEQSKELDIQSVENEQDVEEKKAAAERVKGIAVIDSNAAQALHEETQRAILVDEQGKTAIREETAQLETAKVVAQRVGIERQTTTEEQQTKDLVNEREINRKIESSKGAAKANASAKATEMEIIADAELTTVTKKAEATEVQAKAETVVAEEQAAQKTALAKAVQSELAAPGLAEAEVEKAKRETMDVSEEIRTHEITMANINNALAVELAKIDANKEATVQSSASMAQAYAGASINLVGSNSDFADQFVQSKANLEVAKSQPIVGNLVEKYSNSEADLMGDLQSLLSGGEEGKGLDVSTLLALQTMQNSGGLQKLIEGIQNK